MKILVDLNVILDVVQRREPHYTASAVLLSKIVEGTIDGTVPGHAITTVYYLVHRYVSRKRAETTVDWLLNHLTVAPADKTDFRTARQLAVEDFEDAVVAVLADRTSCEVIATRNVNDFGASPVPAAPPQELLDDADAS